MKNILNLLFLSIVFLFSCTENKKEKFPLDQYSLHSLKSAKKSIYLPKNYKKITIMKYKTLLKKQNFVLNEKFFESLENSPLENMLLYDINNIRNIIYISESEYVHFNKELARGVVRVLNSNFIYNDDADMNNYKKIENRYKEFDNFRYVKSKFFIQKPLEDYYHTVYFLSTLNKSVLILDTCVKDQNLDEGIIYGMTNN
jgi:hypothetical protein